MKKSLVLANQQKTLNERGFSETTREITFNFSNFLLELPEHIKHVIPVDFLYWFIGFAEGDGSFIVSGDRLFFILVQKDVKILYKIKSVFGFGSVSKHTTHWRYIVADNVSVFRLIQLFNGNLVLFKTNQRFKLWVDSFKFKSVNKLLNKKHFCFDNAWLSGFIDAEGCFNVQVLENSSYVSGYRIRLRFLLDQKSEIEILTSIKLYMGGYIETRSDGLNFRFIITDLATISKLIDYLNKFPLKTDKYVKYLKWKSLYFDMISKKHLSYTNEEIKNLKNFEC